MLIIVRIVRLPAWQDDEPSYRAEFGWERLRHEGFTGTVCDCGRGSAQDRAAVILTPDQRVWVFLSSSLEEWAGAAGDLAAAAGSGVV
jgi:hypothetical protein